ncbi:MAG: hypothetical protein UW11_C0044G0007 [Parcubacteria group bacterium GW2011_GWA2_43_9b]|nr:MAG: hypothetical protein UW11_C0044G0007 [Parcubacteria group bacterium GW2011_GWA2_43_9b]
MPKVFITRQIPEAGPNLLREKDFEVEVSDIDGVLPHEILLQKVKGADAILSLLTDKIDAELMDAAGPQLKIIANYAVGYDNIRLVESDQYMRDGKYTGWAPMLFLGNDLVDKTLGLIGLGRIGASVARRLHDGFEMKILYYDAKRNEELEKKYNLQFVDLPTLLKESDFVSVHVPLLSATKHLIGAEQLNMMKKTAYLINTSRGPIIDENALVNALKTGVIRGAALDVYEQEPKMAEGLAQLSNTILTPHTASATEETRNAMSELAAKNIIEVLEGRSPLTAVKN